MPLYEYLCPKCGRFELIRKFSDEPLTACPTCGSEVQKLASAPAFHLKGTGWYVTDYAKKSSGDAKSGHGDSGKTGESKSGEGKSSDSKSGEGKSGPSSGDSGSGKGTGGESAKSSKDASSATPASTSKKSD